MARIGAICIIYLYVIVLLRETCAGQVDNLLNRWKIAEPLVSTDANKLTLSYTVDAFVNPEFVSVSLFDNFLCGDGGEEHVIDTGTKGYMSVDVKGDWKSIYVRNYQIEIAAHGKDIPILTAKNDDSSTITYCAKFSVYNMDKEDLDAVEVNYLESLVTLDVSANQYRADILSSKVIMRGTDDEEEAEEHGYSVDTYECDEENNKIQNTIPKYQGDFVRICVSPTSESYKLGVRMSSIDTILFASGKKHQMAVTRGDLSTSHGLTLLDCEEGSTVCAIETILLPFFFDNNGSVTASGKVKLRHYSRGPFPVTPSIPTEKVDDTISGTDDEEEESSESYDDDESSESTDEKNESSESYDDDEFSESTDEENESSESYDDDESSESTDEKNESSESYDDDESSESTDEENESSESYDDDESSESTDESVDEPNRRRLSGSPGGELTASALFVFTVRNRSEPRPSISKFDYEEPLNIEAQEEEPETAHHTEHQTLKTPVETASEKKGSSLEGTKNGVTGMINKATSGLGTSIHDVTLDNDVEMVQITEKYSIPRDTAVKIVAILIGIFVTCCCGCAVCLTCYCCFCRSKDDSKDRDYERESFLDDHDYSDSI